MVKVLVELSSEMQAKIEELIKQGRAKDLHSFIRVALENQLRWEETSEVQVETAKNTSTLYRRPRSKSTTNACST
jgi:Arc/MetJ-type ribon-helix-helix transcriptional regulator